MSEPQVSVIVPTYNEKDTIETCLKNLLEQSYDNYEVIVGDNGSTDATQKLVENFSVKLTVEGDVQSSYAARNKGVAAAEGDILAFIDADCLPDEDWIAEGVQRIQDGADLVGGRVQFTFSNPPTAAEIFDSISNMQIERDVRDRSVAKTANLFVKKTVYQDVGPFPSDMISGGDVHWTEKATNSGYELVYEEKAKVRHPARSFTELLKKQYRVGKGQMGLRQQDLDSLTSAVGVVLWLLIGFAPRPPHYIKNDLKRCNRSLSPLLFVEVFFVAWSCRIVQNIGRIVNSRLLDQQ